MGALKTLLVLGGAGVALNELNKASTSRSANVSKTATTSKTLDTQAVLKAIRDNPDLLALVRGEKGDIGNGYKATSTSSTAIATGSKAFDVGTPNLAYSVGARVRITASSDVAKFMEGLVTAYSGNTLTVNVDIISGSGTLASWNLNVAGDKGATGTTGAAGEGRNLSSIFTNSALENDNIVHLVNSAGVTFSSADIQNALASLQVVTAGSTASTRTTQKAWIDTAKLYKVTFWAKVTAGTTAGVSVRLRCFDKADTLLNKNYGDVTSAYEVFTADATWKKYTSYLGGTMINTGSQKYFHPDTVKSELSINSTELNKTVLFNKIQVSEVDLGSPVPYNLHWLPSGQMVVDTTTSEVGYYNGTSVIWFAA